MNAQINQDKAHQFENGLSTTIQVRDSSIKKYNIKERMVFFKVPAVSVAVISEGNIVLAKAYGLADWATGRKADTSTLFQVASISKTLNALCIMKLVEENKLSLSNDFRDYIKDGSFKDNEYSKGQKITIANLLNHTAGMVRDDGPSGDYRADKPLPTITEIIRGKKPALGKGAFSVRKPNEIYEYSNQAICITQKILEDHFDTDYNRLLTNKVFSPLNMSNSTFEVIRSSEKNAQLSQGYIDDYSKVAPWVFPCPSQGGLVAPATDIARMVIAIQNAYNEKGNTFLKKETVQKMFTPALDSVTHPGELDVPYKNGLGLMLFEKGGRPFFTHAGYIEGYISVYVGSYDGKDGAVVLINSNHSNIIMEILNSIATTYAWDNYLEYNHLAAMPIDEQKMDQLLGNYKDIDKKRGLEVTITKTGKQLFIKEKENSMSEPLYFSTDNTAFILSKKRSFTFLADPQNTTTEKIIIKRNGVVMGELLRSN